MTPSLPPTHAWPFAKRHGFARLALLYVVGGLIWTGLTAALLLLADVSGRMAALASAASTALLVVASALLFVRWQLGTLRAVSELVGLPGSGGWSNDMGLGTADADNSQQQAEDPCTDQVSAAGSSNERLAQVAAVVPGALFCYQISASGSGRYLYASDAVREIYGLSAQELCAAEAVDSLLRPLFFEEDWPALCESWQQAVGGRSAWHCEFRLRHPRRGEIWVEGRAVARDSQGSLWYGMLSDISARKQAEVELRRSEELCRVLVEHNTDAVFLHEDGGTIVQVNSAAETLLGYCPAELLGQTPALFDRGFGELVQRIDLSAALARGETVVFDTEHQRKDGRLVAVEVRIKGFSSTGRTFALSSVRDISERKAKELAVQASEKRFRQLADLVPGVVWCQRGNGDASYLSQRWFEYTGLRDARPESLQRIVHPDDLQSLFERFDAAGQARLPFRCEYRLRHADGRDYRWFLAYAVPQLDGQGRIEEWFGLAIDIDDLKRTEAALREERDRFDRLASVVPGVLHTYRLSPDGQASFPYVSPSCESILGLAPEQLADFAGQPQDFIHPDDLLGAALAVQKSASELANFRTHYRFRHPHKGWIWIEILSAPVREADGSTVWQGIISDVGERIAAAVRLRESEQRYRQLADAIPQVVWTTGPDGQVAFLNRRAREYAGLADAPLSAWSWEQLIHPDDRAIAAQCWLHSQQESRLLELAIRLRRADGEYRWQMLRHTPMEDEHGVVHSWCGISTDIDDLKQVELALRAERDRFSALVSTVPGVIFACQVRPDGSACFPFVSPQIAELYAVDTAGLSEDAGPVLKRIHPEDVPAVERSIRESARSLRLWRCEYRLMHPTRGDLWVEGAAIPTRLADRSILWQGFLADIDDRKRAERAQQQQIEMLRMLSSAAADLLVGADARTLLSELFDAVATRLGCDVYTEYALQGNRLLPVASAGISADALSGQPIGGSDLLCGSCAEQRAPIYLEYLQKTTEPKAAMARAMGLRVYLANPLVVDGELVGTLCFASRYKDTLSEVERSFASTFSQYVAIGKARQRTNQALRESEEKYRRLVQMLPVAVLVSSQGRLTFCNAAFARLLGASEESQLSGKALLELIHPDYQVLGQSHLQLQDDRFGAAQGAELRMLRGNGTSVPVQMEVTRFQQNGQLATMVAVVDLTEREEELSTRRKLEEQVWQAQKLEATGRLAGGVAHDFNNLLTIINGCCHLLQASPSLSELQQEALAGIESASERAARLTKQLLALSRKALIEPRVLDLNALVLESAQLLRRLLGEDIGLSTKLDPLLMRIKADPGQLDQVILNLAVNSRDAMPRGGLLSLETGNINIGPDDGPHYAELRPGPYVRLSVSDNGMGIPADIMANIFEPFFTTKPPGRGTGLGLAVVHGIVKQSGGHISVYSEPGLGTTFMLLFPAVPAPLAPRGAMPMAADAPRGCETILLVDDEPEVRRLARLALVTHGYSVLEANNGEEALRVAAGHPGAIQLLVTDLVMPRMGGRLLAHTLRQRLPGLRVLFISGFTDDSVVRHGLLDAAEAFMQKPFAPIGLAKQVRALLDRKLPPSAGGLA